MGKVAKILVVVSGLLLLFYFAGLIINTPNSTLLNMLLDPSSIQTAALYTKIILVIELAVAVGAVILGFFIKYPELIAAAGLIPLVGNLMWDITAVSSKVFSVNKFFGVILFAPMMIFMCIALWEFWRGRD